MAKSNLLKDAVVLCLITLISGLLVAFCYELTKDVIAANALKAKNEAFRRIFTEADEFPAVEGDAAEIGADAIAAAGIDCGNVTVDEIVTAEDASDARLGYIVSVTTNDGYAAGIGVSVGVNGDGQIVGVEILSIGETAGLGMKAKEADFRNQYVGKAVDAFTVTKGEPASDSEIAALGGATITSSAMTNAVNAALTTALHLLAE